MLKILFRLFVVKTFNFFLKGFAVLLNMTPITYLRRSRNLIVPYVTSSVASMDLIPFVRIITVCSSYALSSSPKPFENVISIHLGNCVLNAISTARKSSLTRLAMCRSTLLLILAFLLYLKLPLFLRSRCGLLALRLVLLFVIIVSFLLKSRLILLSLIKLLSRPTVSHPMLSVPCRLSLYLNSSVPSIGNLATLVTSYYASLISTLNSVQIPT